MSKDEPIDVDAEAMSNDGRGSSDSSAKVERDEIDLRDPVSESKQTTGASDKKADAAGSEVVVDHGRPAPPPPPPPPPGDTDTRPDPPSAPAASTVDDDAVAAGDDVADRAAGGVADATDKATEDVAEPVAAAAGTSSSGRGNTPLIDMGETIADDNSTSGSAWWKYAVALAVPVAVAIALVVALTGGDDDSADLPEFTQGESTEIATGADPAEGSGDTAEAADTDNMSDDAADDAAAEEDVADEALEAEEDADSDDAMAEDDDASAPSEDVASDDVDEDETAATDDSAPTSSERAEANPTEVPDPTPEPDDATDDSAGDSAADAGDSSSDNSSSSDDSTAGDDSTGADDSTSDDDSTSGNDASGTAGSDASGTAGSDSSGDDTAGDGTSGSASGTIELSSRQVLESTWFNDWGIPLDSSAEFSDYTTIEHSSGSMAVSLPTDYVDTDVSSDGGIGVIDAGLVLGGLDGSKILIRRHETGDVDDLLSEDGVSLTAECAALPLDYSLPAPPGYEDLLTASALVEDGGVNGSYTLYEACFGGTTVVAQVALENEDGNIAILTATMVTTADVGALEEAVRTITF